MNARSGNSSFSNMHKQNLEYIIHHFLFIAFMHCRNLMLREEELTLGISPLSSRIRVLAGFGLGLGLGLVD